MTSLSPSPIHYLFYYWSHSQFLAFGEGGGGVINTRRSVGKLGLISVSGRVRRIRVPRLRILQHCFTLQTRVEKP